MVNWGWQVDEWVATQGSAELARRGFLAGALASGVLSLSGCATIARDSYVDVVRRLMLASSQRAFAQLTQPDGFWDSSVARINLPVLFGRPGSVAAAILKSSAFREKLQHQLNRFAEDGARKAAPLVVDTARSISITDALALLKGGKTATTTYLRDAMGPALVNAMIPELDRVMRVAQDPILNQAVAALSGVDLGDAAHALANDADNAIWYQIGAAETEIRADPSSTNDPVLIAGLKVL